MLLKEQLADIHADKLVGVVETYLADGRGDAVRQALPGLMAERPEVRERLEPILERLRASAPARTETVVEGNVTALACGACGGALTAQSPDTVSVVCPYCGTAVDVRSGALGHRWGAAVDPEARFRIGTFLEHGGTRWQAVGMQHFSGTVREWDAEDDAWEVNRAEFTTWWMMDATRRIEFLIDDGTARWWSAPFVPDDPTLPPDAARAFEHGAFTLVDVAGELSYRPEPGERHASTERYSGDAGTSIGRRLGADGEPVEIGFHRERRLDDEALVRGLGDEATLAAAGTWRARARWFLGSAFALLAGYAVLGFVFPSTRAFEATLGDDVARATASAGDAGVPLGTFEATGPLPTYRLRVRGDSLPQDTSAFYAIRLSSSDPDVDAVVPFELWHETGRDSDGFWRDTRYVATRSLRLPVPGRYEVHAMDAEGPAGASAGLVIESNDRRFAPVVVALVIALLAWAMLRLRARAIVKAAASIAHVPHAGVVPDRAVGAPGAESDR